MNAQEFATKVEQGEKESLIRAKLSCDTNMLNAITRVKHGKKWTKIDVGYSGRYMINPEGEIFGIKAYGVPHMGHYFGTLDKPYEICFQGRY